MMTVTEKGEQSVVFIIIMIRLCHFVISYLAASVIHTTTMFFFSVCVCSVSLEDEVRA